MRPQDSVTCTDDLPSCMSVIEYNLTTLLLVSMRLSNSHGLLKVLRQRQHVTVITADLWISRCFIIEHPLEDMEPIHTSNRMGESPWSHVQYSYTWILESGGVVASCTWHERAQIMLPSVLLKYSTLPLPIGWYGVIQDFLTPATFNSSLISRLSNNAAWSEEIRKSIDAEVLLPQLLCH